MARAAAFLIAATVAFLVMSTTTAKKYEKTITVTNVHSSFLSVRCFSFEDAFTVVHLGPWQQYQFKINERVLFPSATMFNCSTNMGSFVAFRYDYQCNNDDYATCDWKFDETYAYLWLPDDRRWQLYDYNPNYESLVRGGVIRGYYAN